MNVTVIYGSDIGTTQEIAERIARKIQGRSIDIRSAMAADFENCDLLILGLPTYREGELQSDWGKQLDTLRRARLASHRVALFGTGDQKTYPNTFADALGCLFDLVNAKGALVAGFTDTAGYSFVSSGAQRGGKFVGLVIDQENQAAETDERISSWVARLR